MFATTKDEILGGLLSGQHVYAKRGTGKTTAILEAAHELGADECAVVVPNHAMASFTTAKWNDKYPDDKPPLIVTAKQAEYSLRGRSLKVLVDERYLGGYKGQYFAGTE